MADLRVWQRRHTDGIVAEVSPVVGMGNWDVCVWHEPRQEETRGGRFGFLMDAHQAADTLAQITFDHRCDARCDRWQPIERRKSPKRKAAAAKERHPLEIRGRITRLIDERQTGTIAGEDGLDYAFQSSALIGLTFGALHVGVRVTFTPTGPATQRAASIRLAPSDVERSR